MVVLLPGSGRLRTPAEKRRPPGKNQPTGSLRETPYPNIRAHRRVGCCATMIERAALKNQ